MAEAAAQQRPPAKVYRDDFVRHRRKGKTGVVLKTVEESLEEESDEERDPGDPRVPEGKVFVAWREGSTKDQTGRLVDAELVEVLDRLFYLNTFVKRMSADDTQSHGQACAMCAWLLRLVAVIVFVCVLRCRFAVGCTFVHALFAATGVCEQLL